MNKSYVQCNFSKWFIDHLKNNYETELYVCKIHISGSAIPFKIKIFDRLTCISSVMQRCQLSRFWRIEPPAILLKIPQSPATVPISRISEILPRWSRFLDVSFRSTPLPLCYLLCNSNTLNHNPLFTIHIDSWVYLTQQTDT